MAKQRKPALPPSARAIAELRVAVAKRMPAWTGNGKSLAESQSYQRRVSTAFAAELRRRGWLSPEREGYAPESWGAL